MTDADLYPGSRNRRRNPGETPGLIARAHELYAYDPGTGFFTVLKAGRRGSHYKPGDVVQSRGRVNPDGSIVYAKLTIDCVHVKQHRLAWAMHYGVWPVGLLDHEDHDPGNNRILNLRKATQSRNIANSRPAVGKSGARGVIVKRGRFDAMCRIKTKSTFIGSFPTLDEAAHAYNKAAYAEHGEFAVLNPIGVDPRA